MRCQDDLDAFIRMALILGTDSVSLDMERPFIPFTALEEYWSRERMIEALGKPDVDLRDLKAIRQSYLRVFSILVLINKAESIYAFIQDSQLDDRHLPFKRVQPLPGWPGDAVDFDRFYGVQWQFCPYTFDRTLSFRTAHFEMDLVLPIVEISPLKVGVDSRTFKVRLHPEYNRLHVPVSVAIVCQILRITELMCQVEGHHIENDFVLKSYLAASAKYFHNEVKAFQYLTTNEAAQRNLISFFGSWTQGKTHNILLEYADKGTLLDYFYHVAPPMRKEDISKFWSSIMGVVKALQCIHVLPLAADGSSFLQG